MNFTAVNFISRFDNIAFDLAKLGKYGPTFEDEAKRIEQIALPACLFQKNKRIRCMYSIIVTAVILFVFFTYVTILQNKNDAWIT